MKFPEELRYTKSHEWAKKEGRRVIVGISDYAQKEISDVVFVELPKVGKDTQQFKPAAVVESVKAAFDIYAPVSGKVIKANAELEMDPGRVNADCYGQGWFFEIEMNNEAEWNSLMTAQDYQKHIASGAKH